MSAEQGVTPPPDANTRRVVFGLPHTRKLDRHGLRVFGINYTCPALQEALLRGHTGDVQLRVDPEDLSHVSVCLGHEWVSAQAVPRVAWGLSLEEWQSIVRELRMRFKAEAVVSERIIREARAKIRAIDAHARQLRRLQPMHLPEGALRRAENHLYLGLRIGPEESAATGDLDRRDDRQAAGSDTLLADVIRPDQPGHTSRGNGGAVQPPSANEEWDYNA